MSQPIAITGANGNLGGRLIETFGSDQVRALVRSKRASSMLQSRFPGLDMRVVDYTDENGLREGLDGCRAVVHLVGILKENQQSNYQTAHEQSCRTLTAALPESVSKIVYLSIVGSNKDAKNACLRSKGQGEDILLQSGTDTVVLQVPMVLGEGDYASAALKRNAERNRVTVFRGASLEQPIYAGDVVKAIEAALELPGSHHFELGGPESLPRIGLIRRAAKLKGRQVNVVSLPISLGMAIAGLLELLPNPPITRAMLGVLDHDDQVDTQLALEALQIRLTSLDEMLSLTTS